MRLQRSLTACIALFALAGAVRGDVIVVDAAGGGAFTQIQPAVDAALEGDTILVKPGGYSGFTVDGKALTVIGDAGPVANVAGKVWIRNLALGQTLTLARMIVQGGGTQLLGGQALSLTDCAGAVRCVHCDFAGRDGSASADRAPAVELSQASDVAFAECALRGGYGRSSLTCSNDVVSSGGYGLLGNASASVAAYDCRLRGGHGGNGGDQTGVGGTALGVAGFMFAARCDIQGGHGGNTDCPAYGCPDDGGGGFAISAGSIGWVFDGIIAGGAAGSAVGVPRTQCPADPGQAYPLATPFVFSVPSVGFALPAVAREGTLVTVTFTGPVGAHVFLNDEPTTTFQGVLSWRGVLLSPFPTPSASVPTRSRRWGAIPASGYLTQVYRVPTLPAGVEAQTRFLQAYRVAANGLTLGSFTTLTVLDSAF